MRCILFATSTRHCRALRHARVRTTRSAVSRRLALRMEKMRCICGLAECVCGMEVPDYEYECGLVPDAGRCPTTSTAEAAASATEAAGDGGVNEGEAEAEPVPAEATGGLSSVAKLFFGRAAALGAKEPPFFRPQRSVPFDLDAQKEAAYAAEARSRKVRQSPGGRHSQAPSSRGRAAAADTPCDLSPGDIEADVLSACCDVALGAQLLEACEGGDVEAALELLEDEELDVDAGASAAGGRTPLIAAAAAGHTRLVAALLGRGAAAVDIDEADHEGRSAFWWACANGHVCAADLLLHCGARACADEELVDDRAPAAGCGPAARRKAGAWAEGGLDSSGTAPNLAVGVSPLAAAVAHGHYGVVGMLVERVRAASGASGAGAGGAAEAAALSALRSELVGAHALVAYAADMCEAEIVEALRLVVGDRREAPPRPNGSGCRDALATDEGAPSSAGSSSGGSGSRLGWAQDAVEKLRHASTGGQSNGGGNGGHAFELPVDWTATAAAAGSAAGAAAAAAEGGHGGSSHAVPAADGPPPLDPRGRDERGYPIWQRAPPWLRDTGGPAGDVGAVDLAKATQDAKELAARLTAEGKPPAPLPTPGGAKGGSAAEGKGKKPRSRGYIEEVEEEQAPQPVNWDRLDLSSGKRRAAPMKRLEVDFDGDRKKLKKLQVPPGMEPGEPEGGAS